MRPLCSFLSAGNPAFLSILRRILPSLVTNIPSKVFQPEIPERLLSGTSAMPMSLASAGFLPSGR